TGKELIAQAIHQNSNRARQAFVPVHCAALAANLLESELFGHEKGAFTGATERRIGRFESADGGTLFLDEIGEIDASTQVKLLRFLETRSFERLGSSKSVKVDVRLVCATNRNLTEMAKTGEFREDLLYRLNVVTIQLPALRQRPEDLVILLNHYINFFADENEVEPVVLAQSALNVLRAYSWPGNIRELRNFCENIVVLKRGSEVTEYDLDAKYNAVLEAETSSQMLSISPSLSKEENEKRLLRNALIKANGNRTKAADLMGISRRTLHRKITQWPELDVGK
ncbi:MAG TPA: transcriptional regulator, partial [Opitutae bacterium]|nr:transcriptional regulator [Opitutae bacterium]